MKKILLPILLNCLIIFTTWAQEVGNPAPDFSYKDYNGNKFTLSDQLGKVVFIFSFGNTCPYCLAIGNETETRINDVYGLRDDFVVVGVDTWNYSSTNASVEAFAEQTGIEYPLLVKGGDFEVLYKTTYDRVLVVDQDGILRHKSNKTTSSDLDNVIDVIEEYLSTVSVTEKSVKSQVSVYPVPANDFVTIRFNLQKVSAVDLKLYNSLGQTAPAEFSGALPAGKNEIHLNVEELKEGLYFYILDSGNGITTGKILVKR